MKQDFVGKKFNSLTVIRRGTNSRYGHRRWICNCDCGTKNILENCVPCCLLCNKMKHTISIDIFLKKIQEIYDFQKSKLNG